jgi:hypothetical protein
MLFSRPTAMATVDACRPYLTSQEGREEQPPLSRGSSLTLRRWPVDPAVIIILRAVETAIGLLPLITEKCDKSL